MAKSESVITGLAIFAFVLAIIAIILTIVLYFVPRPIINDSTPANNTTFSSNKINSLIKGLQDEIDTLKTDVAGLKTQSDGLQKEVDTLKTDVAGLKTQSDELQKEVDTLKIENTNLKNYIGMLPTGTPSGTTVVQYFMDRIGDINPSTSVVDYINVQVLNNSAFITKIVTDKDFNTNIAHESIRQFFGTNNTNTISLINVDDIIVNNSLKPLDKSKVDIQSTRLMTVPISRFNDSGQYLCLIEGTRPATTGSSSTFLTSLSINPIFKLINNTDYGSSGPNGLVKSVNGFSLVSITGPSSVGPAQTGSGVNRSELSLQVKSQMDWKVNDGTRNWTLTTNKLGTFEGPYYSIIEKDGTSTVAPARYQLLPGTLHT